MVKDPVTQFIRVLEKDAKKYDDLADGLQYALDRLQIRGDKRKIGEAEVASRRANANHLRALAALVKSEH